MSAEAATRNYVHVSFDQTECPVDGCTSLKGGKQKGSVPGIKRHVKAVHGEDVYNKTNFPALRTANGPIKELSKTQLMEAAISRGLVEKDANAAKISKEQLVTALTSGVSLVKKPAAKKADAS